MNSTLRNQGYLYTFPKNSFGEDSKSIYKREKKEIIKVIMADDHPYLIHGVESDLNKDPKIKMVTTAPTYDELLEKITIYQPDVILLDLKMPGREKYDFKDFITKIKSISTCKIIVFSNETGWARIHKCLEMGASAYVEKAVSLGRLPELIHYVNGENEYLIFTAEQLPQIQFSPRQREILHGIVDGKENDQIAETLNIEIKTVQSYVNEVKSKLSEAFGIHPVRPRTLILLASKLGFGKT